MNNNEPAAERYSINGFKYFSELAKEYFPDLANASSASKKMRKRIKADKTLNEQLAAAYYTCQTIDISPEMFIADIDLCALIVFFFHTTAVFYL